MNSESQIQYDIRVALGLIPDLRLWRNSVGVCQIKGATVRFGLCVGSSDLIGVLAPTGRLVALEVKTPTGKLKPEQVSFLATVRRMGGFATVVRSAAEALAAIDRARAGAEQ